MKLLGVVFSSPVPELTKAESKAATPCQKDWPPPQKKRREKQKGKAGGCGQQKTHVQRVIKSILRHFNVLSLSCDWEHVSATQPREASISLRLCVCVFMCKCRDEETEGREIRVLRKRGRLLTREGWKMNRGKWGTTASHSECRELLLTLH